MENLRVYLIGAGAIARHHAAAVAKLPVEDVTLAVTDARADVLAAFVRDVPHARPFPSVAAMLASPPQPDDIVIIATPPASHAALACAALESGRHVLCEKPLAMNRTQARTMLATARRRGRLLGCCSTRFLGLPTTAAVKQLLQQDTLGRLYHASFVNRWTRSRPGIEYQPGSTWFLERAQSGGGVVMDWGPYDFTVLNDLLVPVRVDVLSAWLANPATAVSLPVGAVFDVEEHAGASLLYHLADGTDVHVTFERAACTHGEERVAVELEGTAGAVSWDWLMWKRRGEVTQATDEAGQRVVAVTEHSDDSRIGYMDKPLYFFAERVLGIPSPAIVDEQALFNFACVRAIYAAATTGEVQTVQRDAAAEGLL